MFFWLEIKPIDEDYNELSKVNEFYKCTRRNYKLKDQKYHAQKLSKKLLF